MVTGQPLRVLLADDHHLVRAGLRALLEATPGVSVVAEVGDGAEAVRLTLALVPDIALLDIAMPGLGGLAALRRIKESGVATKVLLLSMYDNEEYVIEAVQSGAAGYIVKDAAVDELARALHAVARGDLYLSPPISRKLVQAFNQGTALAAPAKQLLTPRQTEVLGLVALGRSSKLIARDLGLSVKTVETHRAKIMERLDLHDLAALVRYAVRNGLAPKDA